MDAFVVIDFRRVYVPPGVDRHIVHLAKVPRGSSGLADLPNDLEITLRDGTTHRQRVTYPRGHARNPMTDAEVEAKFRRLAAPLMTPARIDRALATLWQLETLPQAGGILEVFEMG